MLSVSIIIPIFGVEKHIERCLRSVMRQDYKGPIECILVDDCSLDASVAIAQKIISEYGQDKICFKWIHHEKNKGLSSARNTGTKEAHGDYIFYLDSDDEIITHAISALVSLAEKYPGVDLVYGDWYVSQKYTNLYNKKGLPEFIDDIHCIAYHLLKYEVAMTAPNKLIRRQYIVQNDLFFLEKVLHEDEYMNFLLANTAQSVAISYVPTYIYYLNPNGITGNYGENNIESIYKIIYHSIARNFNKNIQANIIYCLNLFFNAYMQCKNEQLIDLGKKVLFSLSKYSKETNNLILYYYIRILYLIPFRYFKKTSIMNLNFRVYLFLKHKYIKK